jgi:glucan biosynthesis protein C
VRLTRELIEAREQRVDRLISLRSELKYMISRGSLANPQGTSKTSLALKNLRGVVIILILVFHSFSAYIVSQPDSPGRFDKPPYTWTAFPIIDSERWIGFDLLCAFLFLYLMQLMFFLSGLFVWPSLLRRGWRSFLGRRVFRLGVPFVVGTYLLMPITLYAVYRVTAVDPAWSAFWPRWTALPISPTGPMWFLWFVLVLDIAAAGLLLRSKAHFSNSILNKIILDPIRSFTVLLCVSAMLYLPLAAIYSPWHWIGYGPFEIQATFAPQYALYFAGGVAVGVYGLERWLLNVNGMLVEWWHYWVFGSIAAFVLWIGPTALIVRSGATVDWATAGRGRSWLGDFRRCCLLRNDCSVAAVWNSSLADHKFRARTRGKATRRK